MMMMMTMTINPSLSVMATAPGVGFSGDEVWSDRKAAEEEEEAEEGEGGKITAINIQKSGGLIARIRTR